MGSSPSSRPDRSDRQILRPSITPSERTMSLRRLRSDFIELVRRANQIEMKPGDGERQGQIEVVAKFAKISVQHDPELRDRFGKGGISLLQRLPGRRVEIEHQTRLVQLYPFGAAVGQFPQAPRRRQAAIGRAASPDRMTASALLASLR